MPHRKDSLEDIRLMAHLMRRAGFGDPREELEERASKGYEAVVEELLHPRAAASHRRRTTVPVLPRL